MALALITFRPLRRLVNPVNCFAHIKITFCSDNKPPDSKNKFTSKESRYKIFQDEDSPIILDVNEEQLLYRKKKQENVEVLQSDETENYQRGITGVFDVEELVEALKKDNAKDVFVVTVPKELKYVDYMVIVTGRSKRHLLGLAEYIRGLYKKKRHPSDRIPHIEGENSSEWIALDLGNIALHIMAHNAREKYDLESLWSVGPKYDLNLQTEDNTILELLKKHSILLDDIQPLKGG